MLSSFLFKNLPLSDFLPSLRPELIGVFAPDFLAVVHSVSRNTQHGALREVVACNLHAWSRRNNTRQTLARSAVDAEGFLDAHVEVRQVLDLLVGRDVVGRQGLVELGLQFLDALRVHEHVEEQGARGVGGGV
jgi:hypothetical protein